MFVINQKTSRQFQIRYTFIFMLIVNSFFLNFLFRCYRFCVTYSQSKFMTHKELNRVKNIFKNCCSILLNCEKITKYRRNEKLQNNKMFETRMHTNWLWRACIEFNTWNQHSYLIISNVEVKIRLDAFRESNFLLMFLQIFMYLSSHFDILV